MENKYYKFGASDRLWNQGPTHFINMHIRAHQDYFYYMVWS